MVNEEEFVAAVCECERVQQLQLQHDGGGRVRHCCEGLAMDSGGNRWHLQSCSGSCAKTAKAQADQRLRREGKVGVAVTAEL